MSKPIYVFFADSGNVRLFTQSKKQADEFAFDNDQQPVVYKAEATQPPQDERGQAFRYCETCEQNVSNPCNSADCSTPEVAQWAASAPAQQAGQGWKLVPIEPTTAMVSAMACSQARDVEGQFPSLLDLIDYSGENKTHTVLKAAYRSMLDAAPTPPQATTPQPVAAEVERDARRYRWLREQAIDGAPGVPVIALPNGMKSGYYLNEETADFAIDSAMAGTGSDESKKGEGNG